METATSLASSFWSLCHQKRLVVAVAFTLAPCTGSERGGGGGGRGDEALEEEAKRNVQRARERERVGGGGISPVCKRAKGSEISKQPKGLLQDG